MFSQIAGPLVPETQARVLFLAAALGSGGVFLITDIFWLVDRQKWIRDPSAAQQRFHFMIRLYCTFDLAILLSWGILLVRAIRVSDFPACVRLLQVLSVIGATGVGVAVLNCYRSCSNSNLDMIAKL